MLWVQARCDKFRVYMKLYDANGTLITDASKVKSNYDTWSDSGMIYTDADATSNGIVSLLFDDSIKYGYICIGSFTKLYSFNIMSLIQPVYSINITPNLYKGLSSIPTCEGVSGDFVPDKTGTNLGWLYTNSWSAVNMPT